MIIKKFQGKTKEEATEAAKKELGENAIVLTTRTIRPKWYQLFKKPVVEVTVAKEDDEEIAAAKKNSELAEVVAKIDSLREHEEKNNKDNSDKNNSNKNKINVEKKIDSLSSEEANDNDLLDSGLNEKLDNIQHLLQEKLKNSQNPSEENTGIYSKPVNREYANNSEVNKETKEPENAISEQHNADDSDMQGFLELLQDTMVDNEVDEKFAKQMITEVKQNLHPGMDMEYVLAQIYQKMILQFGKAECITPANKKGPKLVYFIGPTGVGKTTTLAKVASQLSVVDGKKIALFTADTYRIAATDQLKTYANIMDVPFHIIYSVDEMQTNFDLYKDFDYILVDTAGHSHHNEEQRKAMNEFVHAFDDKAEKEVFLVLSATTKYRDLVSIADTYKEMADYKLIFTKLDETSTYGNLLNLKIHTGAGLSYITCGQNVPDDIEKFDPQDTVKKLLSTENN